MRFLLLILCLSVFGGAAVLAAERPHPSALLAQADNFRQQDESAELRVKLKSTKDQKPDGDSEMRVRLKEADLSLVEVLSGRSAGQVVLMSKEAVWVRMPRASLPIRITPIQRLMGEASYGDLGRLRWQDDYAAQYQVNAEQTVNDIPVWALSLTAAKPTAAYAKMDLYVARDGGWPVQAAFYLKSGKLFKTARFDKPVKLGSRVLTQRTVLSDGVDSTQQTEMIIESVTAKDFPSQKFTLDGLME
ncbi:outer membrane lipoprotein-sorting protein [Verminephrobacter aporrectodeae subsp. tuberculatae]|uniref:Outer membrane lipoprotein-sorting protein n=1 Tax=Verminephrobacter aporrectodeae subsp. tuberculatae TaxID=1110392 RepID=A0ABT3KNC0_9BURK|nr:outer membrane lipoprotein-sorting protein [Verminephrobacter aporrectodeae]MCW5319802.1 outer membrane lipoprotein-sorting protein [Verminephrobacter aporrectodeae subsp. tuberculatae]